MEGMRELPKPEVYEQEFSYMPWKDTIRETLDYIQKYTPLYGSLIDLMCGPGYLLGKIAEERPDLSLSGIDNDARFISFAKKKHHFISFTLVDVLTFRLVEKYDVITCTAGLHHLPYEYQENFLIRIKEHLHENGFAVVADPYVDSYKNEEERRIAAARLGYEYLAETIRRGGDEAMQTACINIIHNDVFMHEYKRSIKDTLPLFHRHFSKIEMKKTWPTYESEFGDYVFIVRR